MIALTVRRRLRGGGVLVVAVVLTAGVPRVDPATAGADGPAFSESNASIKHSCLGSSNQTPALCEPKLSMDPDTGTIRADLSITTPGEGYLPGWGTVHGKGKLVTTRHIEEAAKAVRFEFRVRFNRLDFTRHLLTGPDSNAYMSLYAVAIHSACESCKGWSDPYQQWAVDHAEGPSPPQDGGTISATIRNRKGDGSLVPPGDVRVAIVFRAQSKLVSPRCCYTTGVGGCVPGFCFGVAVPVAVFPRPPGSGGYQSRLWATVLDVVQITSSGSSSSR